MPSDDAFKLELYKKVIKKEERKGAWRGRIIRITETAYLSDKFKGEFEKPVDEVMMTPDGHAFKSNVSIVIFGVFLIAGYLYLTYKEGKGDVPVYPAIVLVVIMLAFLVATYLDDKNDSIKIDTAGIALNGEQYYWEDDIMSTAILTSIGNKYTDYKLVLLLNNNKSIVYNIAHFRANYTDFMQEISAYIQYFRGKHVIL